MRGFMTVVAVLLVGVWLAGCDRSAPPSPKTPTGGTGKGDEHGHEHGHEHHDHAAHGPHGGHIIELGHEEYHAEWTHDDESGKVTVYILDGDMKNEVKIESPDISINTKIGDAEKDYTLAAEDASDSDPPQASKFSIEDKALVVALEAAGKEGASARLKVKIKNKEFSSPITHDAHDH